MQILLSYPSTQSHVAERVQQELEKLPRLTLHTKSSPSEADLVMVILDGDIPAKVQTVIQSAQAEFKQILPILVDDAELPESLIGAHHINLSQNPEAGLRKLVAEMRNRLGIPDGVTSRLNSDPMADKLDYLESTEPISLPQIPDEKPFHIPWAWIGAAIGIVIAVGIILIALT